MTPVLIKRYKNRRLYDTGRSGYVTLDSLAADVASGRRIRVVDEASGEDLTRRTLVQLLLTDAHAHKLDALPDALLQTLIEIEDPSLLRLLSHYLELTLQTYTLAQQTMQKNLELLRTLAPKPSDLMSALGGLFARPAPEDKR